jgi:hypothetical protein
MTPTAVSSASLAAGSVWPLAGKVKSEEIISRSFYSRTKTSAAQG